MRGDDGGRRDATSVPLRRPDGTTAVRCRWTIHADGAAPAAYVTVGLRIEESDDLTRWVEVVHLGVEPPSRHGRCGEVRIEPRRPWIRVQATAGGPTARRPNVGTDWPRIDVRVEWE